jgi:hypothetical protein
MGNHYSIKYKKVPIDFAKFFVQENIYNPNNEEENQEYFNIVKKAGDGTLTRSMANFSQAYQIIGSPTVDRLNEVHKNHLNIKPLFIDGAKLIEAFNDIQDHVGRQDSLYQRHEKLLNTDYPRTNIQLKELFRSGIPD